MTLNRRNEFLNYSAVFLLVMLCLSLALAAWAGISPLSTIHWSLRDFGIGVAAAFAMILVFSFVTSVRNEAETILGPALASCRWYDLIILAALVGLIEELMFRGVLEPWAAQVVSPVLAFLGVNILFGLLHAVSISYAIVATILGAILSCLAHGPGEFNLLRPIVAHGVYDYIGFLWLVKSYQIATSSPLTEDPPIDILYEDDDD